MKLAIVDFPRHVRVPTEDGKEQLETQVRAKDGYELYLNDGWVSVKRFGRTVKVNAAGVSLEYEEDEPAPVAKAAPAKGGKR